MCEEYGEANTQRAIEVVKAIRHNYPTLQIARRNELTFAKEILDNARMQVEHAAQDGRAHTLPETLEILHNHLGPILVQNPEWERLEDIHLKYGDENLGKSAMKQQQALRESWIIYGAGAAIVAGIIVWRNTGELSSGFAVTVITLSAIVIIYTKLHE